jgi:hypothetical protein
MLGVLAFIQAVYFNKETTLKTNYFKIEKTLISCWSIFTIFLFIFCIRWIRSCHQRIWCFSCCFDFFIWSNKVINSEMNNITINIVYNIWNLFLFWFLSLFYLSSKFQNWFYLCCLLWRLSFYLFNTIINILFWIPSPSICLWFNLCPCYFFS